MPAITFVFLLRIIGLLLFVAGSLWMWGIIKVDAERQAKWDNLFVRSRGRFKYLFPIAALTILWALIRDWQM